MMATRIEMFKYSRNIQGKDMSNIKTKTGIIAIMAILMLFVPAVAGTVVTQDVEIRGEIFTGDAEYNYANGAFFWYDLDKNQTSETMTINCSGTDNRTINEGDLVYRCTPRMVKYKNDCLNTTYGKYKIIGFMADKYICYDNRTDQLVKLLINWGSSDKMNLEMNDPMELPEGYTLVAPQIDLQGKQVWLKLYKDGEYVENSDEVVPDGGTYVYKDDDDVMQLSVQIDSVFRGTESNIVQVKYVFMRSETIRDIDGGDNFGAMEVKSTSGNIVLENDETITLDEDSEVEIMDGLYFKVADDDDLRYYLAKTISLVCPEYSTTEPRDPCPPCDPCPEPEIVIEYINTTEYVNVTAAPDAGGKSKGTLPGFESGMAIIGLLAVAVIVLRQRN